MIFGINDRDGFQDGLEGIRYSRCSLREIGRECRCSRSRGLLTWPLSVTRMVNTDCSVTRTTALTSLPQKGPRSWTSTRSSPPESELKDYCGKVLVLKYASLKFLSCGRGPPARQAPSVVVESAPSTGIILGRLAFRTSVRLCIDIGDWVDRNLRIFGGFRVWLQETRNHRRRAKKMQRPTLQVRSRHNDRKRVAGSVSLTGGAQPQ